MVNRVRKRTFTRRSACYADLPRGLLKRGQEVQICKARDPTLVDSPRDLGLEGAGPDSNRFITERWQMPFGSILSRSLKMKGFCSWAWNGVWLSFSRLNEEEGNFGFVG